MPKNVEKVVKSIQKNVKDEGKAIAIAKSQGLVKQAGKHLSSGPKLKKKY